MRRTGSRNTRSPGGYTLLEMLLSVAVLVILAGLAATPLLRQWNDTRLGDAAENVRVCAAGCRIRALDSDLIWEFRFEPGGTHYLRIPQTVEDTESSSGSSAAAPVESAIATNGRLSGTLPPGLTFGGQTGSSEMLGQQALQGLPDSTTLSQTAWSLPVEFFPDGTATAKNLEIVDERGGSRRLSIRELTGAVSVASATSLVDLPQQEAQP